MVPSHSNMLSLGDRALSSTASRLPPVLPFSVISFLAKAVASRQRTLQSLEFLNNSGAGRAGGPAQVLLIRITIQTGECVDVSMRALTQTQTVSSATGLAVPCSSVGGYRAPLSGLPHYLQHNQAWLQNNLIPPTGTPHSVVAMRARCPAPGYNFTPLCPT